MADPSAPTAQHLAATRTSLRRALTLFRGSTYHQGAKTGDQDRALVRSALEKVINQLRVRRSPVRPRLSTLYREARDFADALSVVSWGHHSCEYNLMAAGAATTTIANVATLWRRCNGAPEQHTGQPVWSYYHRQQREWCLATSVNSVEEGKATRN